MTWQPSHRREGDGEIRDKFTEGDGDGMREVGVSLPEVYGERDPTPDGMALRLATELAQQLLRSVLDACADGPKDSTAVRVAAWRKHFGYDARSYSEIAADLGISAGNLHRLVKQLPARLNGISEGKLPKK
jgi:DNA-directed RNA polymerase specialized sigma24 family protein